MVDAETGVENTYCGASKQWSLVDPNCSDNKSLHYAGEDRVFLIVKNKYTNEWEFPITTINFGQTFFRAKYNLFEQIAGNKWRIKFFGSNPLLHTLRELAPIEKENFNNQGLRGVRTYFFGAHHLRGLPEMIIGDTESNTTDYNDWAWIPKRQLNKYFTKENYEVFTKILRTR